MTKSEIYLLKKARKECIQNAEQLLWGSETEYPEASGIVKAGNLLDMAERLDRMITAQEGS